MTRFVLFAALLLSGCAGLFGGGRVISPYKFGDKGELVDFNYGWPGEASAIPALETKFRADLDKAWREALAAAVTDRALATANKREFSGYRFSFEWLAAGQSRRLLSLEGVSSAASGNSQASLGSAAFLWDRRTGSAIAPAALLTDPDRLSPLLHGAYCKALDRERVKRRALAAPGGPRPCPAMKDVNLVPSDANSNERFEALRLTVAPFVAGTYAEGYYQVILPVTPTFLAALKPVYRPSFEVGQPQ
ncbi:MAG TPA: hypothetical protein VNI79_01495 [Sphingomicrobium sp.]|nr:hypothetical protein [Sphingomicrobium sp.]